MLLFSEQRCLKECVVHQCFLLQMQHSKQSLSKCLSVTQHRALISFPTPHCHFLSHAHTKRNPPKQTHTHTHTHWHSPWVFLVFSAVSVVSSDISTFTSWNDLFLIDACLILKAWKAGGSVKFHKKKMEKKKEKKGLQPTMFTPTQKFHCYAQVGGLTWQFEP